ncbi:carboxylesterase [Moraxella macacae 0408225]|uniref:Carboxylesterase n=1 Tax=Moraxella macacae 0408225 TaxID=1230338 RepID=L2F5Z8_9GAMM|nr:dienelactone hydrolase family protein [Moraxella macacae]ELA08457.1 carboxylesterase [Moraxella macacae 0408225]
MNLLDCVEVVHNPNALPITHSVIWLHGLGANGHDFEPIVPELDLDTSCGVRFIFPHAPSIPVTINGGYVMPAWYDILEASLDRKIDVGQIEQSSNAIKALILREMERGIPSERIVLAGFSQGGAVAYQTALTFDKPLAGLLALSTYLATKDTLSEKAMNPSLPILIQHGTQDPIVAEVLGQQAVFWLKQHGFKPVYQTYPMAHQVCLPQIKAIGQWLNQRFV